LATSPLDSTEPAWWPSSWHSSRDYRY
jgi:hypothetical protein